VFGRLRLAGMHALPPKGIVPPRTDPTLVFSSLRPTPVFRVFSRLRPAGMHTVPPHGTVAVEWL